MTHSSRPLAEAAGAELTFDEISLDPVTDKTGRASRGVRVVRPLAPGHRSDLHKAGISDDVINRRGYETLMRTNTDSRPRDRLQRAGFAVGAYQEDRRFPGLLIPLYNPRGVQISAQYRPDHPRRDDRGKVRRYEAVKGRPAVLDVHPLNFAKLADPSVPLWLTEGVKKADALTTAGVCVIALAGVFNWRSSLGTLGDWEDVALRGRDVVICYDSDAATNRNVAAAMVRLRRWLLAQGARVVRFVVTPAVPGLGAKTGVDDFLGHGGTVAELLAAATTQAPDPDAGDDSLSDSRLAEQVAELSLVDQFRFVRGLGWLEYDGIRWRDSTEARVIEKTRLHMRQLLQDAVAEGAPVARLRQLTGLQSAARIKAVAGLTAGMDCLQAAVEDFDADPWLLNAANGVIDLRTGELREHDPEYLMRHGTSVAYRPEAVHPDWDTALQALPDPDTAAFVQRYLGSGATGETPREDIVTFWHGSGSNGKSTMLGAVQAALGSYARGLLPTMLGGRRDEHSTEYVDLLGVRLAFVEETGDGHRLDTVKMKKFTGTEVITGRRMRQDSISFRPSHTLVVSTNHRPQVTDTDQGTWRRLRMVPFPKTFGLDGQRVDRGLRSRLMTDPAAQEAVLAWLVQGATLWYLDDLVLPEDSAAIREATQFWRESTDFIYAYSQERLIAEPGRIISVERVRDDFNDWLPEPHQKWGKNTFAERFEQHEALRKLGAVRGKDPVSRRAVFKGIGLRRPDLEPG